jgi:phosphoheptose isomerase
MPDDQLDTADLTRLAYAAIDRSIITKGRLGRTSVHALVQATELVRGRLAAGGKVLIFGNGGSASDAQHIAAELVGRYVRERPGMPAIALNTDTSALTAIGNDYGYEAVFSRQVEALGSPGDVAIGISTSGNSPNVVAALVTAKTMGLSTIAFVGGKRSKCHQMADVTIGVPATETARIQECHILLGHILCELLDARASDTTTAAVAVHHGVTEQLIAEREEWRMAGVRVVMTNGVFDLLHAGHLTSLEAARDLGDVLIVAINDDSSVRRLKGDSRPIVNADDRGRLLAGLEVVDRVVIFDDDHTGPVVAALQPDVWCKGAEYADRDPATIPEIPVVHSYGGEVAFLPMVPGRSTTATVERLATPQGS